MVTRLSCRSITVALGMPNETGHRRKPSFLSGLRPAKESDEHVRFGLNPDSA
jgi:hypothetical protein